MSSGEFFADYKIDTRQNGISPGSRLSLLSIERGSGDDPAARKSLLGLTAARYLVKAVGEMIPNSLPTMAAEAPKPAPAAATEVAPGRRVIIPTEKAGEDTSPSLPLRPVRQVILDAAPKTPAEQPAPNQPAAEKVSDPYQDELRREAIAMMNTPTPAHLVDGQGRISTPLR
jgi:hypothetical protein